MKRSALLLAIPLATLLGCGVVSGEPKADVSWEKLIELRLRAEGRAVPSAYDREKQGDTEGNRSMTEEILLE